MLQCIVYDPVHTSRLTQHNSHDSDKELVLVHTVHSLEKSIFIRWIFFIRTIFHFLTCLTTARTKSFGKWTRTRRITTRKNRNQLDDEFRLIVKNDDFLYNLIYSMGFYRLEIRCSINILSILSHRTMKNGDSFTKKQVI